MDALDASRSLACAAIVLLGAACSGGGPSPVEPDSVLPSLSVTLQTESLTFHLSPSDSVESEWQEEYHQWATGRLAVALPGRLHYYKYASEAQMHSLTGRGCCFAEPERLSIHTRWTRDNHEVVHVYSARIGRPSDFFNEGLAVSFQTDPPAEDFEPRWNGVALHALAARFHRQGSLPTLEGIIETDNFRRLDPNVTYPVSGSFTLFLMETHGLESVLTFFQGGRGPMEPRSHIHANFRSVFGRSLADAERAWHERLSYGN